MYKLHELIQRHIILDVLRNPRPPCAWHSFEILHGKSWIGVQLSQAFVLDNLAHAGYL